MSVRTTQFAATPKSPTGNSPAGGSHSSRETWLTGTDTGRVCRLLLLCEAHQRKWRGIAKSKGITATNSRCNGNELSDY